MLYVSLVYPFYLTAKLAHLNFHALKVVSCASSDWKLFRFDKIEVKDFEILLISDTFYLQVF